MTQPLTVIVRIRHPRYTRAVQRLAREAVRVLPASWRHVAYWRLLALVRAAPRFVVLRESE